MSTDTEPTSCSTHILHSATLSYRCARFNVFCLFCLFTRSHARSPFHIQLSLSLSVVLSMRTQKFFNYVLMEQTEKTKQHSRTSLESETHTFRQSMKRISILRFARFCRYCFVLHSQDFCFFFIIMFLCNISLLLNKVANLRILHIYKKKKQKFNNNN